MLKSVSFLTLTLAALVTSFGAYARSDITISAELSAMMLDPRFDDAMAYVRQIGRVQKFDLQAVSSTTLDTDTSHWVYLGFNYRSAQSSEKWRPLGNIVGQYQIGASGEVLISAVYYEPAAQPPPAAGGGN